ncbi:MAG: Maf family protein [Planctomycetaceae bacterium]
MIRLILASRSPHRLRLLQAAGYDVRPAPVDVAEPPSEAWPDLETGLLQVSQQKAWAACRAGAQGLVLAADTVGHVAGKIMGKPRDRSHARQMLEAISGTEHEVLTGWCLLRTRDRLCLSGVERTGIVMRAWTNAEIEQYLASGEWEGKSGAYGLQQPVDPFVTAITGSAANVIGVPIERLNEVLAEFPALASQA